MNRIGASAASADELRAVPAIAGELETLPINQTFLQPNPHQPAVVRNAVERTELVGAHIVTRGKMTAEMLEALPAPWAREALAIEPGVNFRDRMKLTRVQICLSVTRMTAHSPRSPLRTRSSRLRAASLASREFWLPIQPDVWRPRGVSPCPRSTWIYF